MDAPIVIAVLLAGAPAAGPSFDCAKARAQDEKLVCGHPKVASLDRRMADTYAWLVAHLPKEEADRLRKDQKYWLSTRAECSKDHPKDYALTCTKTAYDSRIEALEWERDSHFPPEGISVARLHSVTEKLEIDVAYPVLEKGRPGAAAFNSYFLGRARELAKRVGPAESGLLENSVTETFVVRLATPRLVTVLSHAYLYEGGPHGLPVTTAITFDLERGRPLSLDDVFDPSRPWRRELRKLALARVEDKDEDMGDEAGLKEIAEATNWTFEARRAVLTFPVYSIAPYPSGEPEARFTWDELRPFLRPNSPLPPR